MASFEPEHAASLGFGEFLVVGAALAAHHGRENRDALLALADVSAKFEPEMIAPDVTRFGALAVYKKHVSPGLCLLPDYVKRAVFAARLRRPALAD